MAPQASIEPTHPQPACGRLSGDLNPTDPTHRIPTEFRRRWAKSAGGASGTDIAKADGRQMGVPYGPAHVRLARGCRLSRAHARIFDRRMHEDSGGWRSGLASRGPLASSLGIGCPHELARCFSTPFFLSADAHHLQPARRPSGSAAFRGRSLLRGVKSKRGARLADAAPHRTL